MIVDTKISELLIMSGSSIDETTYIPVVTGTFPVNRKLAVKDIMITTFETDPIYTSEKDTLALKTDLDNYSLTGHTHNQYLESETDPIYTSEKDTLALKTDLDNYSLTGHTHTQYLESETDPIYTSEKDTLALKTDLDNYSLTGHTHYELYSPTGGTATVYVDNGGNLHIDADIYQNGSGYTTHTEQLYTKKDYIYLREDSTTGLSTGEYTGFEAINYDGVNNGRLVFDNTGTARVGDVGFEQPLSTREETPIDNGVAIWDNDTVRFITSTGLTFDNTDLKVNGINVSLTGHTHSQYLESETDPIYTSEKNTLALKTDLDNYSLTGHTHSQYLETETDPIYTSEKNTLALKTDLDNYSLTGHTHSEYITGYTAGDNITIENGIISSTGGGGPSMGISTQTGTAYTLDIDDAFSIIKFDNENSIEVTIPTESSVNFDIPTQIDILQYNLGAVTVKGADGVTLLSSETGFTTNGRYTTVSIIKTDNDTWNLFGADDISVTGSTGGSSLWTSLTGTRVSDTTFTVGSDITSYVAKGMVFKWTESSVVKVGMVSIPSTYSDPNTTVTIIGDTMSSIDEGSLKYCMLGVEMFQKNFAYAGTIGSVSTNVMNTYYATEPMRVLGCDLQVGTAGTTNSTTIDINKGGTSMFTTKPTLGSTVETSSTPFTADNDTSLVLNDKVTIDIDAVQTTPAIDMYVQLYVFPTRYLNLN